MKKIYFTVGPTQIYPTVEKHVQIAIESEILSLSHRGNQFSELMKDTLATLRIVMNIPQSSEIFFTASSLENMERTIQNCVEEKSFHIVQGAFSAKFAQIAKELGKHAMTQEIADDSGWTADAIQVPDDAELICVTQNDTSNGVAIPLEEIYALKNANPNKLVAIDVVSSVPYEIIDFKKIDIAFFSVQKGFGLPAGLGVLIVSSDAMLKAKKMVKKGYSIGSYHSFLSLKKSADEYQTPETPNVLAIYLLNSVSHDLVNYGLKKMREETEEKAKELYTFFSTSKIFSPYIQNSRFQSQTTLVINTKGKTKEIKESLAEKGFIIGTGYGKNADQQMRIANFPSNSLDAIRKLINLLKDISGE